MTALELQERYNALSQQARDYHRDHSETWSNEDEANWKRIGDELAEARKAVDAEHAKEQRARQVKELEDESKRAANNPHGIGKGSRKIGFDSEDEAEKSRLALTGWAKGELATPEERQAAIDAGLFGRSKVDIGSFSDIGFEEASNELCGRDARSVSQSLKSRSQTRALSAINSTTGGYTVPASFRTELEVNMLAYPGVMQAARIVQTGGGEEWRVPTFDGTSMTASASSENTDQGSSSEPTFGRQSWFAYDLTTGMLKVPNQLFTDSAFNIDTLIAGALGEAIARKSEVDLTTGNGVNKPYGVVTASTLGVTTASATAITYEEFMDLLHAVPLAYRNGASFMMHDDVTHYARKLKDSEGRFLWVNGTEPGMGDRLCGRRVYVNQAMTGFTSGALVASTKHVLCGNFNEYIVRFAGGVVVKRVEERYVETNQTGFIAMRRYDGNILTAGATKIVHMLQHS